MFTSCYHNLKAIKAPLVAVSISIGKPRTKGGWKARLPPGVEGREYPALAPTWAMVKGGSNDDYDVAYNRILRNLDARKVYDDLGDNAVLLCFEKPGEFCHRRIVAEWLESELGIVVPELGFSRDDTEVHASPLYDFYVEPERKLQWIEEQMAAAK